MTARRRQSTLRALPGRAAAPAGKTYHTPIPTTQNITHSQNMSTETLQSSLETLNVPVGAYVNPRASVAPEVCTKVHKVVSDPSQDLRPGPRGAKIINEARASADPAGSLRRRKHGGNNPMSKKQSKRKFNADDLVAAAEHAHDEACETEGREALRELSRAERLGTGAEKHDARKRLRKVTKSRRRAEKRRAMRDQY